MNNSETLTLIKESFESWYNSKLQANEKPVSVVINYSDEQKLSIKAFHTITMELTLIGIKDGISYTTSLVKIQENYNHGITSEIEAKEGLTKKLLMKLYGYWS